MRTHAMNFVSADNITQKVLEVMAQVPDPRLREVSSALVRHLHAFIREVRPTDVEFETACAFMVGLGKATSEKKNEVILASDILGASTLITLQNDQAHVAPDAGKTASALLGPFWRAASPPCTPGDSIARGAEADAPGQTLLVQGTVRNASGQPLEGAVVDVWQASPVGLYENQDDSQPDMNLRGRFSTDALGHFHFRSVRPAGYPVPVDGPCGVADGVPRGDARLVGGGRVTAGDRLGPVVAPREQPKRDETERPDVRRWADLAASIRLHAGQRLHGAAR